MAPGRCLCGGWYKGGGHCSNGVDRIDGRHKGPGWVRRHRHELLPDEEARLAGWEAEVDDSIPPTDTGAPASSTTVLTDGPPAPAPVAQVLARPLRPLPSSRCFMVTCRWQTEWLATCERDGRVTTAPACRRHLIQLLAEGVVEVLRVQRLPPRRTRSADAAVRRALDHGL